MLRSMSIEHPGPSLAGLCLPAAPRVRGEYRALFPEEAPDTETKAGKAELLAAFGRHLAEWGPMLQRFLRDEDDQVSQTSADAFAPILIQVVDVCEVATKLIATESLLRLQDPASFQVVEQCNTSVTPTARNRLHMKMLSGGRQCSACHALPHALVCPPHPGR